MANNMEMIGINLCLAILLVALAFFRRDKKSVRTTCAILFLAIQSWLAVHYATAYRSIGSIPTDVLQQDAGRAWYLGVCAMNGFTLHSYIPTFMIYGIALVVLVIIPPRSEPDHKNC